MDEETLEQLLLKALVEQNSSEDQDNTDEQTNNNSEEEIFVTNIPESMELFDKHSSPKGARYRSRLINYIIDPKNRVFCEPDICHNFYIKIISVGDYDLAIKYCNFVLSQTPYNRDIIADIISACGNSNQFELGDKYLARAMEIPYKKWTYRLFTESIDFLKQKFDSFPMDDETYNRALALCDEYIKQFPFDEHGYNQKAELMLLNNQRNEALSMLHESILDTHPDPKNTKSILVTSQCCITLLKILDDSNDYDFIIEICDRGMRNSTQEQPSTKVGFFMYRKALALDAKAHAEGFRVPTTITEALKFYQSAYDLNQGRNYSRTIEQRYAVLRPYVAEDKFIPLIKRSLFVTEANASNSND